MSESKAQKIVVFLSLENTDKNLIINGIRIATIFKKELCLCFNTGKKNTEEAEHAKQKLADYVVPIKNELPELQVSTLVTTDKLKYLPEKLADDYEAIILIAASGKYPDYAKAVEESPVPFLYVNEHSEHYSEFKKVVLPVDLRKENSESIVWTSYFGRFNEAALVVVAASQKNKDDQKQVKYNAALAKKLFQKFEIEHKIYKGAKSSFQNAFEALEMALASDCDLFVVLGSSVITSLDRLIGLPEKKILKRAGNLPVLLINPRKDNYILCD